MKTNRFIKLGTYPRGRRKENITILVEKETEKAICLKMNLRLGEFTQWLPKSQVEVIGDYIAVPDWLADQKELPTVKIVCKLTDIELKEKTGLDLRELTAADRIGLLQKELAYEEEV